MKLDNLVFKMLSAIFILVSMTSAYSNHHMGLLKFLHDFSFYIVISVHSH